MLKYQGSFTEQAERGAGNQIMEGLNGHFCHGFYPQVCPKSLFLLDIFMLPDSPDPGAKGLSTLKRYLCWHGNHLLPVKSSLLASLYKLLENTSIIHR